MTSQTEGGRTGRATGTDKLWKHQRIRIRQKRRAELVAADWGTESIQFHAALQYSHLVPG